MSSTPAASTTPICYAPVIPAKYQRGDYVYR